MVHKSEPRSDAHDSSAAPRYTLEGRSGLVSDGFPDSNLVSDDAPPPYGEMHDELQFSQPGFDAGAIVTGGFFIEESQ